MEYLVLSAVVVLTFASSIYVWRSDNIGLEQKNILLFLMAIPPIQWQGILFALLFNHHSSASKQEKRLLTLNKNYQSSIDNLTELRRKGILEEYEYYEKVAKIKNVKAIQDIKDCADYKQLKKLLDSDILSREEFDRKVLLVKPTNITEKASSATNTKSSSNKVKKFLQISLWFIYGLLAVFLYSEIIIPNLFPVIVDQIQ